MQGLCGQLTGGDLISLYIYVCIGRGVGYISILYTIYKQCNGMQGICELD